MVFAESFGLRFDHLGLATRREDDSVKFLSGLGYIIGARIYDPLQKVNLRLCRSDVSPAVELVVPAEESGPLERILSTTETDLYHICYATEDLKASLDSIKSSGARIICVSAPKPAVLFDGRLVSFYQVRGFGLIELLET